MVLSVPGICLPVMIVHMRSSLIATVATDLGGISHEGYQSWVRSG